MRYFLPKVNIQIYQGDTIVQNVTGIVSAEFNSSYTSVTNGTRLSSITPSGKEFDSTKIDEYVANQFAGFSRIIIFPTEDVYPYEIYAFIGFSDNRIIMRGGVYNSENEYHSASLNTSIYRATLYPYIEFSVSDSGHETLNIRAESRNGTTTYEIFGGLSGTDIIEYTELGELVGIEAEPSGPISYTPGNTYNIVIFNVYEGGARFAPLQYGTTYSATIDGLTMYANANYMVVNIPDTISDTFIVTFTRDSYSIDVKFIKEGTHDPGSPGPYDQGGTSTGGGGGGSFFQPDPVETVLPDGSSELDSSNAGVFTRYLVSPSQLKLFGDWLWTEDIIQAFLKEIMNIVYGKSSEAVISLMSYPFSMAGIGLSIAGSNLWFGNMDSGVISSGKLTKEFASIDWGTISLDGYWNNFLDYAPHTTINLYLPWLGFVPIDPHECLPGTLTIKTNVELGRGTAVHNVIGNGGVCIGQYSTVCGRQLPITALDTGGKLTSMVVSAVAAGVSAGAAGGAKSAGIAAANSWQATVARYSAPSWEAGNRAVEALAARAEVPYRRVQTGANRVAAASAVASLRPPQIHQRSGSSTGNSAGLGCQYPYVIIGRPEQSVPEQYGSHFGYPSNIYAILGTLKGYTEISSIHLDGFACTTEERSEIDELLKGGVIF